jgi:O-antigen ligase
VDSIYLSLLVEVGIVGTISFLLLVIAILAGSRRSWSSAVGLALGIALVGLLTMGAFASILKSTQPYAAFCVLAALGLAKAAQRSEAWNGEVVGSKTPAPVPERIAEVPGQRREGQQKPLT